VQVMSPSAFAYASCLNILLLVSFIFWCIWLKHYVIYKAIIMYQKFCNWTAQPLHLFFINVCHHTGLHITPNQSE
jgi:hypothetical protein